jgi:hypothetical protein
MAAYPGCLTDLNAIPRPAKKLKSFAQDHEQLVGLLGKYMAVAGSDATLRLSEKAARSARRRLDRIERRTVAILEAIQPADRGPLGGFVDYVRRLADAVGRERALRRWTTPAGDPLHGEKMHGETNIRMTAHVDVDVDAMLDEHKEDLATIGPRINQPLFRARRASRTSSRDRLATAFCSHPLVRTCGVIQA